MRVFNSHQRELAAPPDRVGALIDGLASQDDPLWPHRMWPRMRFDRPLGVGAAGGHGPIRYFVESYSPGASIRFRFTGPRGFDGYHACEVVTAPGGATTLRHVLEMNTGGLAILSWPLLFRPLHDALVEDAMAQAQRSLGLPAEVRPWSWWVRGLRWTLSGGRAPSQV